MTMLYRLELAEAREDTDKSREKIQEINSQLAKQMRILAEIARKKDIPVLVTNQLYSEFLSEEEFSGKKKAILRKHRSLREKELDFEIINNGIKKKGWI